MLLTCPETFGTLLGAWGDSRSHMPTPSTSARTVLVLFLAACAMELSPPLQAQLCAGTTPPCVLTAQYDNNRDGYNPYETKITPTNLFRNGLTLLAPLLVDTPPSTLPRRG